jgi:hypothetical protein
LYKGEFVVTTDDKYKKFSENLLDNLESLPAEQQQLRLMMLMTTTLMRQSKQLERIIDILDDFAIFGIQIKR